MKKVDFAGKSNGGPILRVMNVLQMMIPPLPWHQSRHRPGPGDRVVLLHGLWRSVWAMEVLARHLNAVGLETLSIPYPSFRKPLPELVEEVAGALPPSQKTTHFVTHSMGGIVLRCLAAKRPDLVTGGVVMLAPPNHGSEIIDWLADSPLGKYSLGPGGMSLSTDKVCEDVPNFPVGQRVDVIMGRRCLVPFFRFLLEGENDGIVTVEGGRLPGVRKFAVVDADHTFMMANREVLERVVSWLQS